MLIDPSRPDPRLMPVVTVFPAGSLGARTPGAHDVEPGPLNRPIQNGAPALPLTRPPGAHGVGCHIQRQGEGIRVARTNKPPFSLRSLPPRYVRGVEASKGPCPR